MFSKQPGLAIYEFKNLVLIFAPELFTTHLETNPEQFGRIGLQLVAEGGTDQRE